MSVVGAQELEAATCSDGGYSCFDGCQTAVGNIIPKLFNYVIRFSCCPISSPLHPGAPYRSASHPLFKLCHLASTPIYLIMHWYLAVRGYEVDVTLVSGQQQLKYNFNEILRHNERIVIRVEAYRSNGSLIKY